MKHIIMLFGFLMSIFGKCQDNQPLPCDLRLPYSIQLKESPIFLPDSLGGNEINGRFITIVFFDDKNQVKGFNVQNITLHKGDSIILHIYKKVGKTLLQKTEYTELDILKFYDFIAHCIYNNVEFVENKPPESCTSKPQSMYFYLPIGKKKSAK